MKPTIRNFRAPANLAFGLFVLCLLFAALPAAAQTITVTSAVPDMAEQETYGLVVRVTGNNFGADAQVDFLVTGTADPGGITVRSVKRRNPKTLDVTIDVAPDAQTQLKFDIQVRSGGRTGKGTELFKVVEKTTGPDALPPGEPLEFGVQSDGLGSAVLTWSAPADDGYEATSGTPAGYRIKLHTGGEFTFETWDAESNGLEHSLIPAFTSPWPSLFENAVDRAVGLAPDSTYWVAVRAYDEADNWSGMAQSSFTTPAAPLTGWYVEPIDRCLEGQGTWLQLIDVEVDRSDQPALLYSKRCSSFGETPLFLARASQNGWAIEALPLASRDPRMEDLAFDPVSGEPTLAHVEGTGRLVFYRKSGTSWRGELVERSQAGVLALAYAGGQPSIAYKRGAAIRIARLVGSRWETTQFALPNGQNSPFGTLRLIFDGAGSPAVAYGRDRDGDNSAEVIQLALQEGGGWRLETIEEVDPGWMVVKISIAWDPHRSDFSLAYEASGYPAGRLRVCDRAGTSSWACATVGVDEDHLPHSPALACDATGTTTLFYTRDMTILEATTRGTDSLLWSDAEYVTWDVYDVLVTLQPKTGEPLLATQSPGAEPRLPTEIRFARRLP